MTEPDFPATREGADAVVRRGNRRRLRTAALSMSTAVAVAGVVVLAPWQGAEGRDSLTPARDPLPHPSVTSAPATPLPSATPRTPAPPASLVAASRPPVPVPSVTPEARPTGAPAPPVPGRRTSPISRGTGSIAMSDLCSDDQTDAAQGWCLRYTGPATARRGHPVTLSMELCRLGSFPTGTVTFSSTRETILAVRDAGWSAGQGEQFTSPGRTITLPGTTCLTWASTWDTRGSDGFLVLPGDYTVDVGVESNLALTNGVSGTLTVTD